MRNIRISTRIASIVIVVLVALISVNANGTSDEVTMPWNSYLKLLDAGRDTPVNRLFDCSYESVHYEGVVEQVDQHLQVRFSVTVLLETYEDRVQLIPVLSSLLQLERVVMDDQPATWLIRDEASYVVVPGPGRHRISGTFTQTMDVKAWPRSLTIPLYPVPTSSFELRVADGDIEARIENGVLQSISPVEKGSSIKGYFLPASTATIRWLRKGEEKRDVQVKAGATVQTYVSLEERGATCTTDINYRILQGETNLFMLRLPEGLDVLSVMAGEGQTPLSQWYIENDESGVRRVVSYAAYRQNAAYQLRIVTEMTASGNTWRFTLPSLVPLGVERFDQALAVGSGTSVEIREIEATQVEQRDARFLSSELQAISGNRALYSYKVLNDDFKVSFEVTGHERAPVVSTIIESAHFDTVLTENGTMVTKAMYSIRNNQSQYLRMQLPGEARILSANLDGREIQPALDGDDVLVPLEKSASDAFTIELAYQAGIDPFRRIGRTMVSLPDHEAAINRLTWNVYIPQRFQVIAFGGNIERVSRGAGSLVSDMLEELASMGSPSAYASNEQQTQQYEYNTMGLKSRFKKGAEYLDSEDKVPMKSQVQVQIPVTGQSHRFDAYLVRDFVPYLSIYYINSTAKNGAAFLFSMVFFFATLATLLFVIDRQTLPHVFQTRFSASMAAVVVIVSLVFLTFISLGISESILTAIFIAVIVAAFRQNRILAAKYRGVTGKRVAQFTTMLLLIGLTLVVFLAMMIGGILIAGIVAVLSLLFHAMLLWSDSRFVKRRQILTMIMWPLLFSAIVAGPTTRMAFGQVLPEEGEIGNDYRNIPEASISVPWSRMEKLLENAETRAQRSRFQPPFRYFFGDATITGHIDTMALTLFIRVPLAVPLEDYVTIDLFSFPVVVRAASLDKEPLGLNVKDGRISCEIKGGKGETRQLELDISMPVSEQGGVLSFALQSPLFRSGTIELNFGEEITSIQLQGVAWQRRSGRKINAALRNSATLQGELATFERQRDETGDDTSKVKKIYSNTFTLFTLEESVATFYSSIRYQILNDQVREFRISVPSDVTVHEIVAEDLETWQVEETKDNVTIYRIRVLYPVLEKYDLSVHYEKVLPADTLNVTIPGLEVLDVARDIGYIGVELQGQAEVSLAHLESARIIDIQELPDIIRQDASTPFVFAFRYVEQPFRIDLSMKRHAALSLDPAIIDRIDYTYVLSPQGNVLAQAHLLLRNSRKQFATCILPRGARLLSTFMDDESIKASTGSGDTILLPLKRQSGQSFSLDVVYEITEFQLGIWGKNVELPFPSFDIPTSLIESSVYMPRYLYVSAPKRRSDLQTSIVSGYIPWGTSMTGGIVPSMISRGRADVSAPSQPMEMALQKAMTEELRDETDDTSQVQSFTQTQSMRIGGIHSLKIDLPKIGRMIRLSAVYIPEGKSPTASFFVCHRFLSILVIGIVILLLSGAGAMFSFISRHYSARLPVVICLLVLLLAVMPLPWQYGTIILCLGAVIEFSINRYRQFRQLRQQETPPPQPQSQSQPPPLPPTSSE